MRDVKIDRFLHKDQHAQRKFSYFVNRKNGELVKIGHFQCLKSIFKTKNQINLPEKNFLCWIWNYQNNFYQQHFQFQLYWKTLFSKNGPNFWWLPVLSVYKISKFSLSMLISKQKVIIFSIPYLKTPQLKLPYLRLKWVDTICPSIV